MYKTDMYMISVTSSHNTWHIVCIIVSYINTHNKHNHISATKQNENPISNIQLCSSTPRLRPNGQYFADDIFTFITWCESYILIQISMNAALDGLITNKSGLACHQLGDVTGHYLKIWWSISQTKNALLVFELNTAGIQWMDNIFKVY